MRMSSEPGRLDRLLGHIGTALRALRTTDDPAALSDDLALIMRGEGRGFGNKERAFLLAASVKAANPEDAIVLSDFLNGILDEAEDERRV